MTFIRPTLSDLIERNRADLDARLPGADSRMRRSVLDVIGRVHSGALSGSYGYLDWLARQLFADTADATELPRRAAPYGLRPKPAVAATGNAAVTGLDDSEVPADTVLIRSDGARYVTTVAVTIAAGVALLDITAEEAGPGGVMAAGQKLTFASPVIGVSAEAIVAASGIGGGAADEDVEALRSRLLDRIRKPPEGGSKSDYRRWMLEVAQVTRAWVYPNWMGPGTVGCTFVCDGRADMIPLQADLDAVAEYLDERRPVTADPVLFAPTPVALGLVIRAAPDTETVRTAIEAEIDDLLFREAEPGGTILISHIREAISVAGGEADHELASPLGDLTAGPGEMHVRGNITWIA